MFYNLVTCLFSLRAKLTNLSWNSPMPLILDKLKRDAQFLAIKIVLIVFYHLSHLVGKPTMWFPNRSDTNRDIQSQKMVRSLKFWS